MTSLSKRPDMTTTPARRKLYAALHAAAAKAGLDDESYRAMLVARTGKASAKDLSDGQIRGVLDHLNGGTRPQAARRRDDSATSRKIRALWLSLYQLGVVRNPSETALAAFVKATAKVDDLHWLSPRDAYRVIEALKDMATRSGVHWADHKTPQEAIIAAQLAKLGQAIYDEMQHEVVNACNGGNADRKLTALVETLGQRIREASAEGSGHAR